MIRRWGHASCVNGENVYIFGGRCGNKDLQNFVEINLISGKCSEIRLKGNVKGRRKPGMCFRNNTMFVFSGFDGSYLRDFLYIDLTSRPSMPKKIKNDENVLRELKKMMKEYDCDDFDRKFSKDVVNLEHCEYKECLRYMSTNIKKPLEIAYYPDTICGAEFVKRSKYFEYLMKNSQEEIVIYKPEEITLEEYEVLLIVFLMYMKFGKLMFHSLKLSNQFKMIPYLIEMAEYYCIEELKEICHQYALEIYEQKLKSTKTEVSEVLDNAYEIKELEEKYGEYACYLGLKGLINKLNLDDIYQLERLVEVKQEKKIKQKEWIMKIMNRFGFELR